jgi:uncharacterized protein (DUF885 family)
LAAVSIEEIRMTALLSRFAALAGLAMSTALATTPAFAQDAGTAAKPQTEDERIGAFFEEVFQRNLKDSPIFQAQLGMKGPDYGKWNDFLRRGGAAPGQAEQAGPRAAAPRFQLRQAFGLDEGQLPDLRVPDAVLGRHVSLAIPRVFIPDAEQSRDGLMTFMQNIHSVDTVEDAEAYVSRLKGTTLAYDQTIDVMNEAARRGIVPTSFSFDPVIRDARAVLSGEPFDGSGKDSAILADFRGKVDKLKADDATKKRLLDEGIAAMKGPMQSSVTKIIGAIEALRPKSQGPNGVWKLPDGDAYYKSQIKFWTTTDMTADQIHQIGLDEVARIKGEMRVIMTKVGFQGDLPAFFEHLRTDPNNFFPNTPEGKKAYLDQSKGYIDSIYADVNKYFNVLPKAPLEVRAVEEWREATAPIAFYNQPTPDGSRPGIYYVNLHDMTTRQKHEMETVAYHEGAPGHHFQIAIQQELKDVPKFQNFAFFGAYVEGWGLYAERLAKEEGRFTDPMQDFGRLAERDAACLPPRRRHRRARQALDARADDRVHDVEQPDDRRGRDQGDGALHRQPGPGALVQDRHAEDPRAAREGESRARPEVRHPRLPRRRA